MGKPIDIHKARVLALARPLRAASRAEASGRCLVLSLQLAEQVRAASGKDVELVRWRVLDDPHFRDHWAVWLDEQTVVDPTRVQVDGLTDLAFAADSYPANYVDIHRYPAAMLLADFDAVLHDAPGDVMPRRCLQAFARHILLHDLREAWARHSARAALAALRDYGDYIWWLNLRDLRVWLKRRAQTLSQRLDNVPEFSNLVALPVETAPPLGKARPNESARAAPARRGQTEQH
jgi:hypothetical protein